MLLADRRYSLSLGMKTWCLPVLGRLRNGDGMSRIRFLIVHNGRVGSTAALDGSKCIFSSGLEGPLVTEKT